MLLLFWHLGVRITINCELNVGMALSIKKIKKFNIWTFKKTLMSLITEKKKISTIL